MYYVLLISNMVIEISLIIFSMDDESMMSHMKNASLVCELRAKVCCSVAALQRVMTSSFSCS